MRVVISTVEDIPLDGEAKSISAGEGNWPGTRYHLPTGPLPQLVLPCQQCRQVGGWHGLTRAYLLSLLTIPRARLVELLQNPYVIRSQFCRALEASVITDQVTIRSAEIYLLSGPCVVQDKDQPA